MKFGRLTVIKIDTSKKSNYVYWLCDCDCGTKGVSKKSSELLRGTVKSCGCLVKEWAKNLGLKNKGKKYPRLVGMTFGKWTVIDIGETRVTKSGIKISHYLCECSCDNKTRKNVRGSELLSGRSTNCGCETGNIKSQIYSKDLSGQRFGKLIALEKLPYEKGKRVRWLCSCDCGNKTIVTAGCLVSGNTKSCGCLRSNGENKIAEILDTLNVSYKRQFTFKDCRNIRPLPFDFAIFKDNKLLFLIEFQGFYHYYLTGRKDAQEKLEFTQKTDKIKKDYCLLHNIDLLEIPYWEEHRISDILKNKILEVGYDTI